MDFINVMMGEHKAIRRMLKVMRKACLDVFERKPVDYSDFHKIIDFIRGYADRHHHGKEERLLFDCMLKELGPVADTLIRHGMLVEHELGRLHVKDMEEALERIEQGSEEHKVDLIANALAYTYLLGRHADKEDIAVYTYALRNLDEASLAELERQCSELERNAEKEGVQEKYLGLLNELEQKYGVI